ncbi:MAG: 3-keto-5-aminohexanoate cleavage protein [Desulfosarcinaceae bacterium]
MNAPCIISVAITGSLPRKENNPAVPIHVGEQIASTREAFEAGAALVHVHVREDDQSPSSDPAKFEAVLKGVREQCPGMIIQFSTGGRGRAADQRGAMLNLQPGPYGQGRPPGSAAARTIRLRPQEYPSA